MLLLANPPVYGPVFQGEGVMIGTPTVFVRAAACDYRCKWCDTLYAVDAAQFKHEWWRHTSEEVAYRIGKLMPTPGWVTLSGGNPALQDFGPLIQLLHERGYLVACETQGTKAPVWLADVDHLTVSPKPPSAGELPWADAHEAFAATLNAVGPCLSSTRIPRVCVKVVVFDERDLAFALEVKAVSDGHPVQPEFVLQAGSPPGADSDGLLDRLAWLEEAARHLGVRVLPQLHALVHGARRDA